MISRQYSPNRFNLVTKFLFAKHPYEKALESTSSKHL